jgi:hypothetical protein
VSEIDKLIDGVKLPRGRPPKMKEGADCERQKKQEGLSALRRLQLFAKNKKNKELHTNEWVRVNQFVYAVAYGMPSQRQEVTGIIATGTLGEVLAQQQIERARAEQELLLEGKDAVQRQGDTEESTERGDEP